MTWGPVRGPNGEIVQGGVAPRGTGTLPTNIPRASLYRAIVLQTFATDDPVRTGAGRDTSQRLVDVECDVLLTKTCVRLPRVPVMQRNHGVNDLHNVWIPRPCARVIREDGTTDLVRSLNLNSVSRRGAPVGAPPSFADLDGDHVLVSFLEGDSERPVIVGAMTHSRTRRLVVSGDGWREDGSGAARGEVGENEYYTRHRGTEVRINEQGDMVLDLLGATTDENNQTPSSNTGAFRVRVKGGTASRATIEVDGTDVLEVFKQGSQVRVDLGQGAAQRLILGDDFRSFLNDWLTHVFAQHQHTAGTLVAGVTAVTGLSGAVSPTTVPPLPPPSPLSYTGSQMSDSLLSDLAKTKKT